MNQQIISAKKCSHFALMLHPYYSEVSSRQLTAPEPSTGKRTQGAYPIIHLLPGINEMSLVTTKQLINVHTAITFVALTNVCLIINKLQTNNRGIGNGLETTCLHHFA